MVNAICKEIELRRDYLSQEAIRSIYFGGGTPSVLSKEELQQILTTISRFHEIKPDAEITLEANPDDLIKDKIQELKEVGINRLSIGIQSFDETELKWMNRSHTVQQSYDSVKWAQEKGFHNITIDLIYGSKFQNMQQWKNTLQHAFDLGVQHISAYNLTIEERTVLGSHFKKGKEPAVNDAFSMECFDFLVEACKQNGFEQYEISNFGQQGFYAVHNSNYWKGVNYIGLGPSAHSFNGHSRQWNLANNQQYMRSIDEGKVPCEEEELSVYDRYNEYLLTRLRTKWGVSASYIAEQFGKEFLDAFLNNSKKYLKKGDLIETHGVFTLSQSGKRLADKISSDLFESAE